MSVALLRAGFLSSFVRAGGEVSELKDPHGRATWRQLVKLNALGVLAVIEPGQVEPIAKGEAAAAIDHLARRGYV